MLYIFSDTNLGAYIKFSHASPHFNRTLGVFHVMNHGSKLHVNILLLWLSRISSSWFTVLTDESKARKGQHPPLRASYSLSDNSTKKVIAENLGLVAENLEITKEARVTVPRT